jgi:hypothetical protein
MRKRFTVHHTWLALLLAVAGCPGNLDDPERFRQGSVINDPLGCGDIETEIFKPKCSQSGCHSSRAPAAGLDLLSPDVAARLVGVPSRVCEDRLLIDPSDPSRDFLVEKLEPLPQCGSRMPLIGKPLSAEQVTCIREWVKQKTGKGETQLDAGAPAPDAASDVDADVDAGLAPDAASPPPYTGGY